MVNHGLDEEEMAFKKSMEAQNGDDIDELFNFSGQDELEFDTNDLDNLEMLQVNSSAPPTLEVATPENKSASSKPSSICKKFRATCRSPPHKWFLEGCSSPFMLLAEHLTALRVWCTRCLPGR